MLHQFNGKVLNRHGGNNGGVQYQVDTSLEDYSSSRGWLSIEEIQISKANTTKDARNERSIYTFFIL
jgi:hypothetical protein